jgi:hypothetical protein
MADTPYPILSDDPKQAVRQMRQLVDELYQERMAGALVGDVFEIGEDDILTINLSSTGGLQKTSDELGIKSKPTGGITTDVNGISIKVKAAGGAIVDVDGLSVDSTLLQLKAEKDAVSGYAGLNAVSRITKGVDTTDDLIVDLATKGLVLKDTQGSPHYWRVTISNLGAIVTADLGTVKP